MARRSGRRARRLKILGVAVGARRVTILLGFRGFRPGLPECVKCRTCVWWVDSGAKGEDRRDQDGFGYG